MRRLAGGCAVAVAMALAITAAPAAAQTPADACAGYVLRDYDSSCGAETQVAGQPLAADCRDEAPRGPDAPLRATTGCGASAGGHRADVDRCEHEIDAGHEDFDCRTGVDGFTWRCTGYISTSGMGQHTAGTEHQSCTAGGRSARLTCTDHTTWSYDGGGYDRSCRLEAAAAGGSAVPACGETHLQEPSSTTCTFTVVAPDGTTLACTADSGASLGFALVRTGIVPDSYDAIPDAPAVEPVAPDPAPPACQTL